MAQKSINQSINQVTFVVFLLSEESTDNDWENSESFMSYNAVEDTRR